MRTEDILATVRTGVWHWDSASAVSTLNDVAARLLDLPASDAPGGTVRIGTATFRSRVHAVDYVEFKNIVTLAIAEGTLVEGLLRIVGPEGAELRTVRLRLFPVHERGEAAELVGTITEVPAPSAAQGPVTGDWRRNREAFLLDAGRALAEAQSTAEVLRVTATLSMPGFSPDGQAVFGVRGDRLSVLGHYGQPPDDERCFSRLPLESDYPAAEVIRSGRAVYLREPEEYRRRFPETWPLAEPYNRRSWAFLPLNVAGRTTGAWLAAFNSPVFFSPDERAVLTTVARMLAQALTRTTEHETERELSTGLQRSMRPVHKPDISGMAVATRYVPTGGGLQVGGDWYDVIPLPSGRTALVIGDVQGHDVRAAGIMAQLRVALRAYASEGHHPEAVLSRASRFLAGMGGPDEQFQEEEGDASWQADRFATCLYVEVDPVTGTLDIARAGHPDPAIRMSDGTLLVRPTAGGLPLGIEPDTDYPTTRLLLEPGEILLLCTDGLLETGGHDIQTGWERIREVFEAQSRAGITEDLESLADNLLRSVHGPPSHYLTGPFAERREDDIALMLLAHGDRCLVGSRRPAGTGPSVARTSRRTVLTVAQSQPSEVREARHQLQSLLFDWRSEDQVDGAVLMLSEMLTNVLVHTDSNALMVAEISGEHGRRLLRVEVADHSDELPHPRHPGEMASSGRGLVLLEMLAGSWGVDPRGEGKSIWFEMREDQSAPQWE